ncbi:MAG: hypothetical protein MUO76_03315, partial [Anaerolineaceae bacterium]|nr:hypothetical protein [Anaerolineaceae bacterium]
EERLKILKLVQEKKITAREGVDLLDALGEDRRKISGKDEKRDIRRAGRRGARWFRVRVTDQITGKILVDIRLPVNVVKAGSKLGARFSPELTGLDMKQLLEYVESGASGRIFELTHDTDHELVEVFIE